MASIKEELPVLGIYHVWSRVAAALAWQGALSSSPFLIKKIIQLNNIILATNCNYVISPYVTNSRI